MIKHFNAKQLTSLLACLICSLACFGDLNAEDTDFDPSEETSAEIAAGRGGGGRGAGRAGAGRGAGGAGRGLQRTPSLSRANPGVNGVAVGGYPAGSYYGGSYLPPSSSAFPDNTIERPPYYAPR